MSKNVSPIVSRIREELRNRYLSPIVPGIRLPPESELLKHFDVSRPTLRKAISGLVDDGLLKRYPGRGTFVLGPDAQDFVHPSSAAIGIICKSLVTSEGSNWVNGALDRAYVAGLVACVTVNHSDIFRELAILRQLLDHPVSGVIVHPATVSNRSVTLHKEVARARHGYNVPMVVLGHCDLYPNASNVWFDEEKAGYAATQHLIQAGHKRIAYIGWPGFTERQKGYQNAMKEAGLSIPAEYEVDITTVPHSDVSMDVGRNAGKILLSLKEPPTAVFAYWTEVAAGVILEAMSQGLRVPEQMAGIGLGQDLSDEARLKVPVTMSTIRTDMRAIGEKAMEVLLQEVGGKQERQSVIMPFELLTKASTSRQVHNEPIATK